VRFTGRPVTVHAARKWLFGESIPTQDKMRTLADWLGVSANWLRYGGSDDSTDSAGSRFSFESDNLKLASDLQLLDPDYRQIVREFVRILVLANSK